MAATGVSGDDVPKKDGTKRAQELSQVKDLMTEVLLER